MRALEELLAAWRANPDPDATVALCSQIGTSGREKLVRELGERAAEQHGTDARVMLALGRMYLEAGLLAESQTALVIAGKADPRDPVPFRWLGEVLLRRGDAARAQRVLERALELVQDDPATRLAHDRATVLMPLQERGGMRAVAAEVERTLPEARFVPDWSDLEAPTVPREAPAVLQPDWSDLEVPTVPSEAPAVLQPAAPWLYRGAVPVTPPRVAVNYGSVDTDATFVMRSRRPASPGAMLQELAAIGLYEPEPLTELGWETPPSAGARGVWVLLVTAVVAIGAGGAAFVHADHVRAERVELGRELGEQVTRLLDSGHAEDLEASDRLLTHVFELDCSSRGAASLWLKDRVLALLLRSEPADGLESAIGRARELGVPDRELAYGRIASKLAAGDLTDAVGLLRRWDQAGTRDAMYQLVAGALLEQAGDRRAVARYQAALALDPHLWAAELLLTTLVLLEQGPEAGRALVLAAARHLGDQPATRALSALLWVVEGNPGRPLPGNAEVGDDGRHLPRSLAAVPFMVHALRSIGARDLEHAQEAIRQGLRVATSPAGAVRLGRLALQAGDEDLVGRAALVALSRSPAHPGALGLAGRWAVVSGRLQEAKRAAGLLDPPESDRLRALGAYEAADSAAFEGACETLAHATPPSDHRGLSVGHRILTGRSPLPPEELAELTSLGRPWAELWAADAALDSGNLPKALELVSSWPPDIRQRAPGLVREARLERYRGRSAEAAKLTQRAAELGAPTPRLVAERVFALADAGERQGALEYAERHATSLGPFGSWLVVFALARSDRLDDAKSRAAELAPPTEGSVLAHVVAARGLAAARDRRAAGYLTDELRGGRNQPDLLRAAAEYQAGINGS
jgi:tetratricopeptide (TPR) repeat protein